MHTTKGIFVALVRMGSFIYLKETVHDSDAIDLFGKTYIA